MTALQTALTVVGAILLVLGLPRIIKKHHRSPAPAPVGFFLNSRLRDWLQPLDRVSERSGVERRMIVLDLGCGSGALTTLVARVVGEQGKVYAVDIQPAMLRQLERKLAKPENQEIKNIEIRQANAYELPFEDDSIDLVLMASALQEIPDRNRALREIRKILKAGGILAVTEFWVDTDYPLRSTTIKLCQSEGFVVDKISGNFWNYTIRFRKPVQTT
ncbi:MAG: methyltransferase domain-containing protein [Chloroflexi bacterium]|nr:methyltransferase domain-containing protein [Chloroflexota bacterium]